MVKHRGHKIENINGEWFYVESGELVSEVWESMACGYCGKDNTKEGHDGCLGTLNGVMNACCGHGQSREAYLQYSNGAIINGSPAKTIMAELKKIPDGRMAKKIKEMRTK